MLERIDAANFRADPTYMSCDEIVTVGGRVLNSRNAFRAQSQLVCAVQCAGKAYGKHHYHADAATPWHLLQSAYGRIRIPIPEGHHARSRVSWLDAQADADTISVGVEDLEAGTLGSKFVVAFSSAPLTLAHLPPLTALPNGRWHVIDSLTAKPLRWLGAPAISIESLAVQASRLSIDRSKEYDRQLGIVLEQDGRLHMALDLRVDRLASWPQNPNEPLIVYRCVDLLEEHSGSHLHQLLMASAETGEFFCRFVVHIVRIGKRQNAERPWGAMTARGVATKPQDVSQFFFYPSLDFEAGNGSPK